MLVKVNVALLRNRSYGSEICPDFFVGEEDYLFRLWAVGFSFPPSELLHALP